ncbi:hypothetical protein GCM10023220_31430 [Streptomyces ziwulingensis]|uniref:Uncharacterized protein n=1 Tax=Streptomyces ziwulingensis TaxID=1045501 RepID=A0ABP9BV62_9ACTN
MYDVELIRDGRRRLVRRTTVDDLLVNSEVARQKVRNPRRDPGATLMIAPRRQYGWGH